MSDPYPEVRDDESGLVPLPQQSARHPDWPKKIRTLTAAELDRLTIDGSGRFYWDGKLVNYEPPPPKPTDRPDDKRTDPLDSAAFEILDRAAYDLSESKTSESTEGMAQAQPQDLATGEPRRSAAADLSAVDLDLRRPADSAPQVAANERSENQIPVAAVAPKFRVPEVVRVRLSGWQSLGAFIVVLGIAVGAAGLAAYGSVAAHDWGCRVGLVKSYCTQAPAARPAPARPDIPA